MQIYYVPISSVSSTCFHIHIHGPTAAPASFPCGLGLHHQPPEVLVGLVGHPGLRIRKDLSRYYLAEPWGLCLLGGGKPNGEPKGRWWM